MPSESRHPVEILAQEFTERLRQGETPSIEEYERRRPELSDTIRKVFAPILAIERLSDEQLAERQFESRTMRLTRDQTQLGDFRIVRQVGRGGMGIVYEAIQQSLGRRVALKVLTPDIAGSAEQVRRFRLEAATFAKLHHTNIVPVFGIGEADGLHFYAMQFIDGATLANVIAQMARSQPIATESPVESPVEPTEHGLAGKSPGEWVRNVAQLGRDVASALQHAHEQGIVHRDIKPGNLMLEGTNVWVTDFGIAKLSDETSQTKTGLLLGTLRYMAPEQFNGQADARSDIYSLGLTLFELLTLHPAFPDATHATLIKAKLHDAPMRMRDVRPDIPRDLETIVIKASATDARVRYQTAADLVDDLQRFLDDRPIRARRASPVERLSRWSRRNPSVAGLSLAVVGSLAALAIVFASSNYRMRKTLGDLQIANQVADQSLQEKDAALEVAEQQRKLAASNLSMALEAFEEIMRNIGSRAGAEGLSVELNDGDVAYGTGMVTDADAEMLTTLLRFFDRFSSENATDLLQETATANRRVGDILMHLGRIEEAEDSYLVALEQLDRLIADRDSSQESVSSEAVLAKMQILNALGQAISAQGALAEAQQYYRQTAELYKADVATTENIEAQFEYARSLNFRSSTFSRIAFPPPQRSSRETTAKDELGDAKRPTLSRIPDRAARRARAALANTAKQIHREAKGLNQEAIALLGPLVESHPRRVDFTVELAHAYREQSRLARLDLDPGAAQTAIRSSLDLLEQLIRDNPKSPYFRFVFADTVTSMQLLSNRRNGPALSRALQIANGLVREYPSMTDYVALKAKALLARGNNESVTESVRLMRQLVDDYPAMAQYRLLLASGLQRLANIEIEAQRIDSGKELLKQAIAVLEEASEAGERPTILSATIGRLQRQLSDAK